MVAAPRPPSRPAGKRTGARLKGSRSGQDRRPDEKASPSRTAHADAGPRRRTPGPGVARRAQRPLPREKQGSWAIWAGYASSSAGFTNPRIGRGPSGSRESGSCPALHAATSSAYRGSAHSCAKGHLLPAGYFGFGFGFGFGMMTIVQSGAC